MKKISSLPFERIDFALPIQTFRIEYSLIERNSVPFVREFILRLLWLGKMSMDELAAFMGFTEKEVRVATSQMLDLDEICVAHDSRLELTTKAKNYFSHSADDSPRIAKVVDRRSTLRFDLVSFNYILKKYAAEDWRFAIKLEPDLENRADSGTKARKAFQTNFFEIYNTGDIEKFIKEEKDYPDIYKISDTSVVREGYIKVQQELSLDSYTGEIERSSFKTLKDQESIVQKITDALVSHRVGENLDIVANSMEELGANELLDLISTDGIDTTKFLSLSTNHSESKRQYIFGSILLNQNWDQIFPIAQSLAKKTSKNSEEHVSLLWMAPSNPFWARSAKIQECLSTLTFLVDKPKTQKSGRKFKLFLPIQSKSDFTTIKRWDNEFVNFREQLFGIKEGFMGGSVEVILWPRKFAVVLFHVVPPGKMVPIPLGFITKERRDLEIIERSVVSYLNEPIGQDETNNLGRLRPS